MFCHCQSLLHLLLLQPQKASRTVESIRYVYQTELLINVNRQLASTQTFAGQQ
jgi:hypothetical protein